MSSTLFREFSDGRAVVLDAEGKVLWQLVRFARLPSGKTKFACHFAPLIYATKKEATAAARSMGFPLDHVERGRSLIGRFWFVRYDFRGQYALACWDAHTRGEGCAGHAVAREKALRDALEKIATSPAPLPDDEDAEGWATLAAERRDIAKAALSQARGGE